MSARVTPCASVTSAPNGISVSLTAAGEVIAAPSPQPSSSPAQIEQLRQKLSSGLQCQPEIQDLLGLCAESNAWTVEEAMQRPDTITTVELFLLHVPRVPLLQFFPNLVTVKLMNIGLESMSNLASLTQVEELWLSDNNIRVIEGLDNMTRLRRLYLQGNCIESANGLPPLRHLRELWLSRNRLSALTHLTPLRKLRSLYVSGNPLESLANAFSKDMLYLHEVNLSGCYLSSITELRHLQQLPCLRHLWLLDPLFGDNPICRLSNYVTLTIAMLGSLDILDGIFVTSEQRSLVESVLHKKQLYYAMRAQMLDTQITLLARHAEACALHHTESAGKALLELKSCLQPIKHELAERHIYRVEKQSASGSSGLLTQLVSGQGKSNHDLSEALLVAPTATLEALSQQLSRAVDTREVQIRTAMRRLAEATLAAKAEAQLLKERFALELHTGGNVRLESLSRGHEAYAAAAGLVQERFDRALFEERFGIASVEVTGVRRVVNRGLRLRFDDRVKELHVDLESSQLRSRVVGLFGIVPVTPQGQSACLQHVLLNGTAARLATPSEDSKDSSGASQAAGTLYHPVPAEEGVPLTNSLFYADEERLLSCCNAAGGANHASGSSTLVPQHSYNTSTLSSGAGTSRLCCGQVVLYRVYLGKTVHALGGGVGNSPTQPSSFLHRNGRVWRKDYAADTCAAYRLLPMAAATTPTGESGATSPHLLPSSYMWYCFDRALLLPDCVVDYMYRSQNTSLTPPPQSTTPASDGAARMSRKAALALIAGLPPLSVTPCDPGGSETDDRPLNGKETDTVEDALRCGEPLLEFIHWCSPPSKHARSRDTPSHSNTLQHVAEMETNNALEHLRKVLGKAHVALLLRNGSVDDRSDEGERRCGDIGSSNAANPLHARHVEEYAAQMCVKGKPLTLCVLRNRGITAVLQDFAASLCSSITSLDLAHNRIASISWFALAKEAPQLQRLNLSGNALTRLHLDGSALPSLRVLDVSNNKLVSVTDFAVIRSAAAALEELAVQGNPFLRNADGQEAEARLWLYLLPPSASVAAMTAGDRPAVVKLNAQFLGAYTGTLAAQRFHRACLLPSGRATSHITCVTACLVQSVQRNDELSCAAASAFGVDGFTIHERCFEQAAAQLEQRLAAGNLEAHLCHECLLPATLDGARPRLAGGDSNLPLSPPVRSRLNSCRTFHWSCGLLDDPRGLVTLLPNLSHLTLRGQALTDVDPLLHLRQLSSLNLAENRLTWLPCLAELKMLRELVVDFNELTALPRTVGPLPALRVLSASGNKIAQIDVSLFVTCADSTDTIIPPPLPPAAPLLEALYLMYNRIADMNVIYALRDVPSLLILSVAGNPCTTPSSVTGKDDEVRPYLIHAFPQLKMLDGASISAAETAKAREVYAGKISSDLLIERVRGPPETWASVRHLNLSHCSLKEVNLLELFVSLEVLYLHHNLLMNVLGVAMLTQLTALDLSHNRLGMAPWRSSVGGALSSNDAGAPAAAAANGAATMSLGDTLSHLKRLQSLSLEANQLTDLSTLKLRFPSLKFLNVRSNELQFIQRGLENLPELRELLLDQNKLRALGTESFTANTKLAIFSAENNALRSVEGLQRCGSLEQVRLGANRLGELSALLHDLQTCPLKVAVFVGNPIARKSNYRAAVIMRFTQLTSLDRRAVTQEERDKAAAARMTELVAPPNVVIDMNYFASIGSASAGTPGLLPQSGVQVNGLVGAAVNGGAVFSSRGRGAGAPVNGAAEPHSHSQPNVTGIRAAMAPNKRGGAADRFSINQRSRAYRR
ncbi:hypothetical protein LSCM1_04997 [Leishmania martiniquensis]|uniref:U2A'/phosphoprotein 32 family A C-terminal domain-containing protein n=1 Tax=Leishmania martiniquensis TaxID=1580590 RepID=A0A836HGZ9_9TRYP|nr:hypothetical protein LSCM1_04997 [Leishmania martiniquensis]